METMGISNACEVLKALEGLDDEELHAVIARAQSVLLDRPASSHTTSVLSVEVVGSEESRLLATYRALAPLAQRRLLDHVARLMRVSRPLGRQARRALLGDSGHPVAS